MKKYKFVKIGAFNVNISEDIFIGNSSDYFNTHTWSLNDLKEPEDNEFMSMEEVEDYINSMESEWNFQGFQHFSASKVRADEPEMIIYYAVFWKETID
jgi:hypothetical protein